MDNRIKLGLGILLCAVGIIILISSFFYMLVIPGGLISLFIGVMLIVDSRNRKTNTYG